MNYFDVLFAKKQSGGGGTPTLITKTITANGTYSASADNADGYSSVTVAVEGFKKKSIANTPTDIASLDDGTANPMSSLEISIEPVQSGSGDPSPSNVRPISGWSGAKIVDDAEYGGFINWNQLFPFDSDSYTLSVGLSASITNGRMVINGTATATSTLALVPSRIYKTIKPINTHKYILHIDGTQNFKLFQFSIYGTTTQSIDISAMTNKVFNCEVVNSTDAEFVATVVEDNNYSADFTTYLIDLTQLFGSTIADYIYSLEQATAGAGVAYFRNLFPHDYYPYNAGEITTVSAVNGDADKYSITSIPFHDSSDNPVTVYGGTLNVTSGELRATHAMIVIDNSRGYQKWSSVTASGFTGFSTPWTIPNIISGRISLLCDKLKSIVGVINDNNVYVVNAQAYFCIEKNIIGGDTAEAWSAWLASNPIQLVYELATPITYQLTPTQVSTLLGQNNIFADCGQILDGEYFVTL